MLALIGKICFQCSTMTEAEALELAKTKLGGNVGVSQKLGSITSQAVSQWTKVPAARVLDIEALTGISRHDLRPDIFGAPKQGEAA